MPGKDKEKKAEELPIPKRREPVEDEKLKTRKAKVIITDKEGKRIRSEVEITKREKGKIVYRWKGTIDGTGEVEIPASGSADLIISASGYVPKKVIVEGSSDERKIVLDRIQKGKGFVVENIYFEFNEAYLKAESLDIIDKLIAIMKKNTELKIEVRGHTDAVGDKVYNQKLSERRADAVVEYMIKNGISPERLRSTGYGQTRPIASNKTEEGRKKNRRTEFFFIDEN